jgi:Flp pilus assembly protein protease CpaA
MLFEIILPAVTFLALIIASLSDIKTREVPDWLNYSLIFSAFGLRLIYSLEFGFHILLSGILGFIPFFLLAYLFYYTDQWGGGDSKLLMAMGAVLGLSYPFDSSSWQLLLYFLALLFLGAIWGLFWLIYEAVRNRINFRKEFLSSVRKNRSIHFTLLSLTLCLLLLTFWQIIFLVFFLFPLGVFYLFIFVSAVEKTCFYHSRSPLKLTEGDWLSQPVIINKKQIMGTRTLSRADLEELQRLHKTHKLETVRIKEGIPFIPSFLFAYIVITFAQNWLLDFSAKLLSL